MIFQGRIFKVLPVVVGGTNQAGGNAWRQQDFVFEYYETPDQRWSDKVVLTAKNDRITEYDLHEGDIVKIGFGHMVSEWNGKYYNRCTIYKFEKVKAADALSTPVHEEVKPSTEPQPAPAQADEDDGLPF